MSVYGFVCRFMKSCVDSKNCVLIHIFYFGNNLFFKGIETMDYDTKANLTTVFSVYLLPVLLGAGVSLETGQAIVGLCVACLPIIFGMLNEMWTSKHLTRDRPEDVVSNITFDCGDGLNTDVPAKSQSDSLGYDGDLVSVAEL